MGTKYSHLSYEDRLRIDALSRANVPVKAIALQIGVHYTTVYRELKRATYTYRNSDYTETERYSPEKAHERYLYNLRAKGRDLKIGSDRAYADYIEHMICDEGYAPGAVLGEIAKKQLKFATAISKSTLYRYIDKKVFLRLTNKSLPYKRLKKEKKKPIHRVHRVQKGDNIEKRPKSVLSRSEFGDWEGDCIEGKKGTKKALFSLVERQTRWAFVILIKEKTAESIVSALDSIERQIGENVFRRLFHSITFDNGSEFSNCDGMEKSCITGEARTKVYYCHPYCPSERGSNENLNRLIRRKFPKGTDFTKVSKYDVKKAEKWARNYPREMFNYRSSADLFNERFKELIE